MADNTDEKLFRYAMITLDEIDVKRTIEIDAKQQKIIGPFKKMQMVMVRGLASNWKQPIYLGKSKENFGQPIKQARSL